MLKKVRKLANGKLFCCFKTSYNTEPQNITSRGELGDLLQKENMEMKTTLSRNSRLCSAR